MTPRYLGLDIGTHTGYSIAQDRKIIRSGVRDFSSKTGHSIGHRGIMFYNFLMSLGVIDEIFYEKVIGHMMRGDQGELYNGFLMLVNMYASAMGIPCHGVWPGTLKKAFTGRGDADKEMMCSKAHSLGWKGGISGTPIHNDEADACALIITQLRDMYGQTVTF